jgi:hypothetical protein
MNAADGSTSKTPSTTTVPSDGGDSFSTTCVPLGMSTLAFAWMGSEKVHVLLVAIHASLCLRMHTITSNLARGPGFSRMRPHSRPRKIRKKALLREFG